MMYKYTERSSSTILNKTQIELLQIKTEKFVHQILDNIKDNIKNNIKNIHNRNQSNQINKDQTITKISKVLTHYPPYDDINRIKIIADKIKSQFTDLIIIGMGGAILNPMSVIDFSQYSSDYYTESISESTSESTSESNLINIHKAFSKTKKESLKNNKENKIKIHIIYHLDIILLRKLAYNLDLTKTAFLIITQSGYTTETLALYNYWLSKLKDIYNDTIAAEFNEYNSLPSLNKMYSENAYLSSKLGKHFFIITSRNYSVNNLKNNSENKSNIFANQSTPILTSALKINATIVEYDCEISGRFSTFTNITILPLLVLGSDVNGFLDGACDVLNNFLKYSYKSAPAMSAITLASYINAGYTNNTNISYIHNLKSFLLWQTQLAAESLCKNARGLNSMMCLGPIEQHIRMQLFLDGPVDHKMYTFIYLQLDDRLNTLNTNNASDWIDKNHHQYDNIESILDICCKTTIQTFLDQKRDSIIRTLELKDTSMRALGQLMMHSIIEIIITGFLLDIDVYGQPYIDDLKRDLYSNVILRHSSILTH